MVLATKILARLLITNGASYVQKFASKTSGVVIMQNRIRRWWNIPAIWLICLAILFGQDVASIDMERPFDLYNLIEIFIVKGQARVIYPEILPAITAMLQAGLRAVTRDEFDPDSPLSEREDSASKILSPDHQLSTVHKRSPSILLKENMPTSGEFHRSICKHKGSLTSDITRPRRSLNFAYRLSIFGGHSR